MNGRRVSLCTLCLFLISLAAPAIAGDKAKANSRVERGKYLVDSGGCHDCHTPKINGDQPDPQRLLSGRPPTTMPPSQQEGEIHASMDLTAWSGPWGISYAANLTPDAETGIGKRYTEAKFIQAIRSGKKPEGEPLLPPMPWPAIKNFNDEDLKSIYAYLTTLKPMKNAVRSAAAPVSSGRQ